MFFSPAVILAMDAQQPTESASTDNGTVSAYVTLNDAPQPELAFGSATEVWYCRKTTFMDPHHHMNALVAPGLVARDLHRTHALLGTVACRDPEALFAALQADAWSPHGEANRLLDSKDVAHTSMSMGDVLVIDGKIHVCASTGWHCISTS